MGVPVRTVVLYFSSNWTGGKINMNETIPCFCVDDGPVHS